VLNDHFEAQGASASPTSECSLLASRCAEVVLLFFLCGLDMLPIKTFLGPLFVLTGRRSCTPLTCRCACLRCCAVCLRRARNAPGQRGHNRRQGRRAIRATWYPPSTFQLAYCEASSSCLLAWFGRSEYTTTKTVIVGDLCPGSPQSCPRFEPLRTGSPSRDFVLPDVFPPHLSRLGCHLPHPLPLRFSLQGILE